MKKSVVLILITIVSSCLIFLSSIWHKRITGNQNMKEEHNYSAEDIVDDLHKPENQSLIEENDVRESYKEIVEQHMNKVQGICDWGFCVFDDEISYISSSKPVPSASVIKIFIMEYIYDLIEKSELTQDSIIKGQSVSVLLKSMITVSDNSATNTFIEYCGMENLNSFFKQNGYVDTELQRKMLDTVAMQNGKDNYTSVNDVMSFLDKLYKNKSEFPYSDMLELLKQQQVKTKIQKKMPTDVVVANKTGELSDVENDVGIIFTPTSDFALVFLCSDLKETSSARNAIANAAYDFYNRISTISE